MPTEDKRTSVVTGEDAPRKFRPTDALEELISVGFVLLRDVLRAESVAAAQARIAAYTAAGTAIRLDHLEPEFDAPGAVRKLRRLYWADPEFWATWICASGLRDVVAALAGSGPALVFHAAFLKPAGVGSAVGFHQDQALWRARLPGGCSFWLPLEPASSDNGGIVVCPGSHRGGLLVHQPDPAHPWHDVVDTGAAGLIRHPLSTDPGDLVVWDRYLVHGSDANTSGLSRQAMVLVFVPDEPGMRTKTAQCTPLADIERLAASRGAGYRKLSQ
jgi:hypothetical protein